MTKIILTKASDAKSGDAASAQTTTLQWKLITSMDWRGGDFDSTILAPAGLNRAIANSIFASTCTEGCAAVRQRYLTARVN